VVVACLCSLMSISLLPDELVKKLLGGQQRITSIAHLIIRDPTHGHDHGDGRHLHHESGSHFHETADRLAAGVSLAPRFRDALRIGARHGVPLRRVYRLERPPRPVIAG
ncbi:hypothetical protein, partial [Chromohalobacter israelensis]|uniref:hypothetical protein n=1 Tax=Chromohalobacter israelensis TaxID=141390 RepID=UPI001CC35B51